MITFLKRNIKTIMIYVIVFFTVIFYGFPMYWMVVSSITPESILYQYPPNLVPSTITFENFLNIWGTTQFPEWFKNSAVIAVSVSLVVVLLATLAGYSLTRFAYRTHGRFNVDFGLVYARFTLFAYMFPRIIFAIPVFIIMKNLLLIDTLLGVAIAQLSFSLPHAMWMLYIFFQSLPIEPEEAALVDGASRIRALFHVVVPMALPAMLVVVLISFVHSWNDYEWALFLLQSQRNLTLPLGISFFMAHQSVEWGSLMATGVLMDIPILVLFIFTEKHLVRGLTAGAVKG